jgi:hypothetical protein
MATISWVIFKHHKKQDGTFNLKIRVYYNGTTVYMPIPIFTCDSSIQSYFSVWPCCKFI